MRHGFVVSARRFAGVAGAVRIGELSFFIKDLGFCPAFRTSQMQVWSRPVFRRPPIRRMAH
ncbi:hypothetical protein, partial [Burkholderia ubonensis]|uniref:hypothetical protein n=1 Tax=Burkholderia ubonensis TaxID=101571 RepID=UPI001E579162